MIPWIPSPWLLALPARAATWSVCASGCDFTTLAAAEAASVDGDVVEVQPGTYPGTVDIDRDITVRGTGPGVIVGSAANANTVDVRAGAVVVLERLEFVDADRCVRVEGATLTVRDSTFDGCAIRSCCDGGAAILVQNAGASLTVERSTFVGSDGATRNGGAIAALDGTLTVSDSTFLQSTGREGGAVWIGDAVTRAEIRTSVFLDSFVDQRGGAIATRSELTVSDSEFERNGSGNHGGAVYAENAPSLVIDGSIFFDNLTQDRGGAVYARQVEAVEITRSDVCGNDGRFGAGVYFEYVDGIDGGHVEATSLRDNLGEEGAGLYARNSRVDLRNVTVVGNEATFARGAVSFQNGVGPYLVRNALVYDNTGYGLHSSGVAVSVDWSAFGANTPADATGIASLGANSLLAVSPDLTRYTDDGDCRDDLLYPLVTSPLVDAGDPAILDADGTRSDIGATGGPYGDPTPAEDRDGDGVRVVDGDCDDLDAAVFPGAPEVPADGVDQDCDGRDRCYVDADGDGFGAGFTDAPDLSCAHGGLAAVGGDCLDTGGLAAATHPGAAPADGAGCLTDADGDGWGDDTPPPGVTAGSDCSDADPAVSPGAVEVPADGVDQDCDGGESCFRDLDGDGHGSAPIASADLDCADAGESWVADDCADGDPTRYPGAVEVPGDGIDQDCNGADLAGCYQDLDGDGVGSSVVIPNGDADCLDPGEAALGGDCDDGDASRSPLATEVVADGIDQDCDGGDTCWLDQDSDGHGDPAQTYLSADLDCADPFEADRPDDCAPDDSTAHPGAAELVADGVDQDCDGFDACWADGDGDGFGGAGTVPSSNGSCADAGESAVATDCDDAASTTFPGAAEVVADGLDQDCDGGDTCWRDADGDGEGSAVPVASADLDCADALEAVTALDCDDGDPAIRPTAFEGVGDGVDQDCDGEELCFLDGDGDGFGAAVTVVSADLACDGPGEASNFLDCDDGRADVAPGAVDLVGDGVDGDCDGREICWFDADLDGYGTATEQPSDDGDCADDYESTRTDDCADGDGAVHPNATEVPGDGVDQNCDGLDGCDFDGDGFLLSACRGGAPGDCDDTVADPPEADGDGIPDVCDVCPDTSDPDQADSDGDGTGDACEVPDHTGLPTAHTGLPTGGPPVHTGSPTGDTGERDPDPTGADPVPGKFVADCGCASGPSSGTAPVAGLGLLALRRRRRR